MKILLALALLIAPVFAQSAVLTATAPAVLPGKTTVVTLTLSGAGTPALAGLQWTLGLPTGWTTGSVTASGAVAAIPKTVQCTASSLLCLVWGLNVTAIPNGVVAIIPVTVPASASPGTANVTLSGLFAGTPAGVSATLTGVNAVITINSPFDINGDGQVTSSDVTAMVAQVASGTCTSDVVGNGQCNVLQIIAEVLGWQAAGSKP
jgi:hypothetical protein